jgi:hypothetical protein
MTNFYDSIQYGNDGNSERGRVVGYHRKPSPRDLSKGAKHSDIANLKKVSRKNLIDVGQGDFDSRFTIGIEIEKTRLHRGAVKSYPLLCGFERDSSCGYEAVTNILPLLPSGQWRNKVFSMFVDAKKIIEDQYSPSDTRCGGHITLAVKGMDGEEIKSAVRKNCGIILALFRKRLNNYYCKNNPLMLPHSELTHVPRYQVSLAKGDLLEFRIPSRFQSVKQCMRRYELMYELLDFSINNPNGSHNTFLKKITPIIKSMYNGDMEKTNEILELSKHFQKFLKTKKINRATIGFLDPMRNLSPETHYDRDLLRNGYRA